MFDVYKCGNKLLVVLFNTARQDLTGYKSQNQKLKLNQLISLVE
jgi:membrane-bound inhibitor of C-type lysozyme